MSRALFVWGGWEGHAPRETAELWAGVLRERGYRVELESSLQVFADGAALRSFDLIVPVWTMGELTPEQELGLVEAVESGVGLAGWHGGMADAFRRSTRYQFMVGGQFVAHPGGTVEYEVHIVNPYDPVTEGISDFRITTEQYYMHVDPVNVVLATTTFSGEHCPWVRGAVMPVAWKRRHGHGKVFYLAIGHGVHDFAVSQVRELMTRGLLWATRGRTGVLPSHG